LHRFLQDSTSLQSAAVPAPRCSTAQVLAQVLAGFNLSQSAAVPAPRCSTAQVLAGCRIQPLCSQQQYQLPAAPQHRFLHRFLQDSTFLQSAAVPAPRCSTAQVLAQVLAGFNLSTVSSSSSSTLHHRFLQVAGCNLSTGRSRTSSSLHHRFLQVATSLQAAPALRCSTGSCRLQPLYRQQQHRL
jgi:hypothetical protein